MTLFYFRNWKTVFYQMTPHSGLGRDIYLCNKLWILHHCIRVGIRTTPGIRININDNLNFNSFWASYSEERRHFNFWISFCSNSYNDFLGSNVVKLSITYMIVMFVLFAIVLSTNHQVKKCGHDFIQNRLETACLIISMEWSSKISIRLC